MIQIFGTPKCSGSRAAQRFFADRKIKVQFIDIREKGLSKGEVGSVVRGAGGLRALYADDGPRAKDLGLSRLDLSDARLTDLLLQDPLLLRTPIVRDGPRASVGEAVVTWKAFAEAGKR